MKYVCRGVVAVLCLFCSCTRPTPQLPANKIKYVDSSEIAMREVNNRLIEYEDSVLTCYVSDSCPGMEKSGEGFWYKIIRSAGNEKLKDKDLCFVNISVFTLDGQLRIKKDCRLEIAKNQIFKGLDDGLRLIGRGDDAVFVFPWYLAYGMRGDGQNILPYTSVKVIVMSK